MYAHLYIYIDTYQKVSKSCHGDMTAQHLHHAEGVHVCICKHTHTYIHVWMYIDRYMDEEKDR